MDTSLFFVNYKVIYYVANSKQKGRFQKNWNVWSYPTLNWPSWPEQWLGWTETSSKSKLYVELKATNTIKIIKKQNQRISRCLEK